MIGLVAIGAERELVGRRLIEALDDPSNRLVVLVPSPDVPVPRERLMQLFSSEFGIGAVVPQVRRPDGHLIEAGAVNVDGRAVSRHSATDGADLAATAADVDGTEYPCVAFRRDLLAGEPLDPETDPAHLTAQILAATRAAGMRIVYEPNWVVQTAERRSVELACPSDPQREAAPGILVVTAFLANIGLRGDDRFAASLIDDLAHVAGGRSLTVAVLDGFGSTARAAALRARGIRVVTGPLDWDAWFEDRWGHFDHVFVTGPALSSQMRRWLDQTQPQAVHILGLDSIPFRTIESLRPVTPADELSGLEYFADESMAHIREWLGHFDVTVCARSSDASYVRAAASGTAVVHVPPPVVEASAGSAPGGRDGLVLLANDGYDLTLGNEAAVHTALDLAVTGLRERHPGLPITIVSDRPSPLLKRTAEDHGFDVVPAARARQALARARVALVLHQFGVGGREAVLAALGSRTPFVASPVAADDLDLGPIRNRAVFGDPADIRYRVERLLRDESYWADTHQLIAELVARTYPPDARRVPLRDLLTGTGRTVKEPALDWPVPDESPTSDERLPTEPPAVRPGFKTRVSLGPAPLPDDLHISGDERYRLWDERHGAGPSILRDLRKELAGLALRPLISVVIPVYNTAPSVLLAAVESVRGQIYENWQLCLADDASRRAETIAALDGLAGDPQIQVVRLEANRGISAATNVALSVAEGDFVAFMDHDDLLKPHALAQVVRWLNADPSLDVIYSDEDKIDGNGRLGEPHLKPDWSPDLLMSMNYVSHLTVMRRSLVEAVGGLREGFDGSQDYDLLLRVTELTDRIGHIPEPLYTWRMIEGSAAADAEAKPYAAEAAKRALAEALQRRGQAGSIEPTAFPTFYRTRYALPGQPRVSIIIPTRDRVELLEPCVQSILARSTYGNFEIVVLDNQSSDGPTLEFLARAPVRVVRYPHRFNYARQMNLAAASSESEVLLFLNNDTEVITPEWIEALLEHAMRPEVGAVGGRLYYTDGKVQHEGILVGSGGGWAWNVNHEGYFARGDLVRNASAVTGACTMIRSTVYARIGGNDERLRVAYNDVDICLRIRQAGFRVVYTPYAELFHHEGATRRGFEHDDDGPLFGQRWQVINSRDPYHSPWFLNDRTDTAFLLAL